MEELKYKTQRNKVVNLCKQSKIDYYEKNIDQCVGDSKQMWKTLKKLISSSSTECYKKSSKNR